MKHCPKCLQTYDDELNFCLSDGASLLALDDSDDSEETIIRPNPISSFAPTEQLPAAALTSVTQQSNKQRWIYGLLLVLAVLTAGSLVALYYERSRVVSTPPSNNQTEKVSIAPSVSPTPSATQTPENRKRYTVNSCGSIQDTQSGIEWFVGEDRNITWHEAREWTSNLNSCGGGWRMPTTEEIRTLYNPSVRAGKDYYTNGKYFPAKIDPVFNAIGGGSWVWSDAQVGSGNARSFNLNQGKAVEYSASNTLYSTRAFAVRTLKN